MNNKLLTNGSYGKSKHALTALVAGALASSLLATPAFAAAADGPAAAPQSPNPEQVMEEVKDTEADLAKALQDLPSEIKNNPLSGDALPAAADKLDMKPGAVKEVSELGGWNAIDGGKFTVLKAREDGLYLNSSAGTAVDNSDESRDPKTQLYRNVQYFTNEQALGTHPYVLALGRGYDNFSRISGEKAIGANGNKFVSGYNGIERSFKAYSPKYGTNLVLDFATGSLAQTNKPAGYRVRVVANANGAEKVLYDVTFNPKETKVDNEKGYTVTTIGDGSGEPKLGNKPATADEIAAGTAIPYVQGADTTVKYATQFNNGDLTGVKSGAVGRFTSKPILLDKGVTDYKVQITPDFENDTGVFDSDHGQTVGLQRNVKHYTVPLFNAFNVDQKTDVTAKELLKAQLEALKANREKHVADKSDPSIANLDAVIKEVEAAVNSKEVKSVDEYKKLGSKLDKAKENLIDIKDALKAIQDEKAKKLAEIDKAPGALDKDKEAAKKAAEAAAEQATAAIKAVAEKEALPKTLEDNLNNIKAVTVSNKEALTAKVADDEAFQKTPRYVNADEHNFVNADGTPNTEKNNKAPEHVAAYKKALEEAKKVADNPTATQGEVDKALAALNKARKDIEDNYATDLEPLKDSVNTKGGVDNTEPIYVNATPEEQEAYDQAKQAAADLLKDPNATQTQVNNAKKALDDAKAALDKHPTDKQKLSAQVTTSLDSDADSPSVFYKNAKDPNYQAPEGVDKEAAKGFADAYDKALAAAKKALADPKASQKQVDAALEALKAAEKDLHTLSSDPTDLVKAQNDTLAAKDLPAYKNLVAKAAKEGPESQAAKDLAAYNDSLKKATDVLLQFADPKADKHPAQKDVEAAKAALQAARDLVDPYATDTRALESTANLEKAIKASPAYANADAAAYMGKDGKPDAEKNKQAKEAKDAYDKALEKALEVLANTKATQAEVDEATAALADAGDALAPFATDASKLAAQAAAATSFEESPQFVNALAAKNGDAENADVAAYKKALKDAKDTLSNPKATHAEVDKALAALKAAEDKIVKDYPTDPSKLEKEADAAADLQKGADFQAVLKNAATQDAAKAYQNALKDAKAVLADKNATQADVDKALATLKAAGEALKKAEDAAASKQGGAAAGKDDTGKNDSGKGGAAASESQRVVRTVKTNTGNLPVTGSAGALLLIVSCALIGAGTLAIRRKKGN